MHCNSAESEGNKEYNACLSLILQAVVSKLSKQYFTSIGNAIIVLYIDKAIMELFVSFHASHLQRVYI